MEALLLSGDYKELLSVVQSGLPIVASVSATMFGASLNMANMLKWILEPRADSWVSRFMVGAKFRRPPNGCDADEGGVGSKPRQVQRRPRERAKD